MATASNWFFWALLSAVFAALTAIFAKIGLEGWDFDLATLVRTAVIMAVLAGFVYFTGKWSNPFELSSRTLLLVLSGLQGSDDLADVQEQMSHISTVFRRLNRRVGCKGVSPNKRSNKYRIANEQVLSLGQYEDAHDAYLAYCGAAKRLHGALFHP